MQETSFQIAIKNTKRPMVVVFSSHEAAQRVRVEWLKTIRDGVLIDYWFQLRMVEEDKPEGKKDAVWFRAMYGLKDVNWGIVNREAKLIASGSNIPSISALRELIRQEGESNPVDQLEAFLYTHPNHEPARFDLIRFLAARIAGKQQTSMQGAVQELAQHEDSLVWGPLAEQLEIFFSTNAWLSSEMDLSGVLPSGDPERYSPLMRSLYRRLRPKVIEALRSIPDHHGAASLLFRLDRVLGDSTALRTFADLTYFQTPFLAPRLPRELPGLVVQDANRSGEWAKAIPLLKNQWSTVKSSDLRFRPVMAGAIAIDPKRIGIEQRLLGEIWSTTISPLLEALVKGGEEAEARNLLSSLDERWSILNVPELASKLANRINRPDLALAWSKAYSRDTAAPLSMFSVEASYQLLFQSQPKNTFIEEYGRQASMGLRIFLVEDIEPWKLQALKWTGKAPRWALLGPEGKVAMEGDILPKPEVFRAQFKNAGLLTSLDATRSFLKDHPGHLGANQALAAELRLIIGALGSNLASTVPQTESTPRSETNLATPWEEYRQALEAILDHPLGLLASGSGSGSAFFPSFPIPLDAPSEKFGALQKLATAHLPEIEAQLENRPTDLGLWQSWQAMAHLVARPSKPILDRIVLSPLAKHNIWDPETIATSYAACLFADGRWEPVITELAPLWQKMRDLMEAQKPKPLSPREVDRCYQTVLIPMVLSCLRASRFSQADEIVRDWAALNNNQEMPTTLLEIARQLGYSEQSKSWKGLFKNSQ